MYDDVEYAHIEMHIHMSMEIQEIIYTNEESRSVQLYNRSVL